VSRSQKATNNHENLVKDYSKKRWLILSLLVGIYLSIILSASVLTVFSRYCCGDENISFGSGSE
jgi:hypothetical protein